MTPKKKTNAPAGRRAKSTRPAQTVAEYFAGVPEPALRTLTKLRATIRAAAPRTATEAISYGIPAFRCDGVLVWYAAFASHCSLFPGGSVLERFTDELAGFKTSKGTVQFPLDEPLPIALITRIVKARIAERDGKKQR
jgi:uncharacterized protein YdhG (YjbR/CyaY superfamily)